MSQNPHAKPELVTSRDTDESSDFVTVVDVAGRERPLYVFVDGDDAHRFSDAVDSSPDGDTEDGERRAFAEETLANFGAAAERLIAAERGDVVHQIFGPELADEVREGLPLPEALEKIEKAGRGESVTADILRRWIELDREKGPNARAVQASAAMTYTEVACRGRGGLPYVTAVSSTSGLEEALELAHRRWEEERPKDSDAELEMVAVFHGRPFLADLDGPSTPIPPELPGIDPTPLAGEEIMRQVVAVMLNREEIGAEEINAYLAAHGADGLYDSYVGPAVTMCEEQIREDGE